MGDLVISKDEGVIIKDREGNILLQKKLPKIFNFDRDKLYLNNFVIGSYASIGEDD